MNEREYCSPLTNAHPRYVHPTFQSRKIKKSPEMPIHRGFEGWRTVQTITIKHGVSQEQSELVTRAAIAGYRKPLQYRFGEQRRTTLPMYTYKSFSSNGQWTPTCLIKCAMLQQTPNIVTALSIYKRHQRITHTLHHYCAGKVWSLPPTTLIATANLTLIMISTTLTRPNQMQSGPSSTYSWTQSLHKIK